MKPEDHSIEELEQKLVDLELQISPPSAPPDFVDTSIGSDQKAEKLKLKDDIKKKIKDKKKAKKVKE